MPIDANELKAEIEAELDRNKTHARWRGTGVAIRRNDWSTAAYRDEVQRQGERYGCHTCMSKLADDADQPWVGDHCPPTNLNSHVKLVLGLSGRTTYLFPQCHECSHLQSSTIRKVNQLGLGSKVKPYLNAHPSRKKLLCGVLRPRPGLSCVVSSGPKVTAAEGREIQRLGNANGCHTCGAKKPILTYHADHTFPQEFCTSYMEQVFNALVIPYPNSFELKPQCARCSGNQGGKISALMWKALEFAKEQGIPVLKDLHF